MKCCICNDEIEAESGYTEGHNAAPVVPDGRCCGDCNFSYILPVRLGLYPDIPGFTKTGYMRDTKPKDPA